MNNSKYKTVKQVADILGVAENTIRNWLREGKLHTHVIEGIKHIDLEELLQVVENWKPSQELLNQIKANGNRATSMADDEVEELEVVTADNPPNQKEEDWVKNTVDNLSSNISSFLSGYFPFLKSWVMFHIALAISIIWFFVYDNVVKTSPIKSSAIANTETWTIVEHRTNEYLTKLVDLNEKINRELEQQKSTRITIYNLEVDIQNSITRVRWYIKQKEQIQSDMIQNSQFQPIQPKS